MVRTNKTQYGSINISIDAIATTAGNAALDCYGVVGLAKKSSLRDTITTVILKKESMRQGVIVTKEKDSYRIDIYLVIAYGVKITEILLEVQKRVKYVLESIYDYKFKTINVFAQNLQRME